MAQRSLALIWRFLMLMAKVLPPMVLTTVIAVGTVAATAFPVQAAALRAARSPESTCGYQYVVTDGNENNVVAYRGPRGSVRQRVIHPNDRFVVFIVANPAGADRVAGRQRTDRGWVSFPRSYLRPVGACVPVASSFATSSAEAAALVEATAATISDIGTALRNAGRAAR